MIYNSTIDFKKANKRKRKIIFLSLLLIAFMFTIEWTKAQSLTDRQHSQSFENIAYKKTAADSAIYLDIFLPDSNTLKKYPVLIIIHGGAWVEGDKELESLYYMRSLKTELLKNRFAVISINYRLVGKEVHLPSPIEDCKDAIRWVRAHADEYKLDTANIGLWGGSAGGHLALMAANTTNEQFVGDKALAAYSAKVNYVIDNFGPTDLNDQFKVDLGWFPTFIAKIFFRKIYNIREKVLFAMTGYTLKENKKKIREINDFNSPMQYINQNAVPVIIFHGTKDKLVPIKHSKELKRSLDQFEVTNEFVIVKNGDHGFNNIAAKELDQLIDQCIVFIKKHQK